MRKKINFINAFYKASEEGPLAEITGIANWASVSPQVDTKTREKIAAGIFPVRLQAQDWNCGTINWLFEVIAADCAAAASVIPNFKQVAKEIVRRVHLIVRRLLDKDVLEKMGAVPVGNSS